MVVTVIIAPPTSFLHTAGSLCPPPSLSPLAAASQRRMLHPAALNTSDQHPPVLHTHSNVQDKPLLALSPPAIAIDTRRLSGGNGHTHPPTKVSERDMPATCASEALPRSRRRGLHGGGTGRNGVVHPMLVPCIITTSRVAIVTHFFLPSFPTTRPTPSRHTDRVRDGGIARPCRKTRRWRGGGRVCGQQLFVQRYVFCTTWGEGGGGGGGGRDVQCAGRGGGRSRTSFASTTSCSGYDAFAAPNSHIQQDPIRSSPYLSPSHHPKPLDSGRRVPRRGV